FPMLSSPPSGEVRPLTAAGLFTAGHASVKRAALSAGNRLPIVGRTPTRAKGGGSCARASCCRASSCSQSSAPPSSARSATASSGHRRDGCENGGGGRCSSPPRLSRLQAALTGGRRPAKGEAPQRECLPCPTKRSYRSCGTPSARDEV